MPVTHVLETCATNLYKLNCTRNLHVCHSDLQQDFFVQVFLHEIEYVLFDVLYKKVASIVQKNSYKFLVQVSCMSVTGFRRCVPIFLLTYTTRVHE